MTTFGDLLAYVENDGDWSEVPNRARGRSRGGDHYRYRKELADGRVLRTKISRSLGKEVGDSLLSHIVHDQLQTTLEEFRAVVAGGTHRQLERESVAEPVPAWLVARLIFTAGLDEVRVGAMTADEARDAWESFTRRPVP